MKIKRRNFVKRKGILGDILHIGKYTSNHINTKLYRDLRDIEFDSCTFRFTIQIDFLYFHVYVVRFYSISLLAEKCVTTVKNCLITSQKY